MHALALDCDGGLVKSGPRIARVLMCITYSCFATYAVGSLRWIL